MTQSDFIALYNKLLELTKKKALKWKMAGEREYNVYFSSAGVSIFLKFELEPPPAVFTIRNPEGYVIAYLSNQKIEEYCEPIEYINQDVSELFSEVEEKVFRKTETKNSLFEELEQIELREKLKSEFKGIVDGTAEVKTVFSDACETLKGWEKYLLGELDISNEIKPHSGKLCLKKIKNNDPNGGYKLIGRSISSGFVFSGWLYRPLNYSGGQGDRISIGDGVFNGYGFSVAHNTGIVQIEKRQSGKPTVIGNRIKSIPPKDEWYMFRLFIWADGRINLYLDDKKGDRLAEIVAKDSDYKNFDRIVIHGGHQYYIDDLKVDVVYSLSSKEKG